MLVILYPYFMYTCLTCLIDSFSVGALALVMCSAAMNLMYLEIVLIKRMPFINMMSPASVTPLYLSRKLVGRVKIPPLMCGFFCLEFFPFRHTRFVPQMYSSPMT